MLEVGHVVKPHGLRGEVVVELVTDRTERVDPGSVLFGAAAGEAGPGGIGTESVVVHSSRRQGSQGPRWLVYFEGVTSREDADRLRGTVLWAPPLPADPGALFVHELIGAEVFDVSGRRAGVVTSVEANPASDLLVLDNGALVPARFVVRHEPGVRVTVDVPEGLLFDPDEDDEGSP